jgi:hypothetical protein
MSRSRSFSWCVTTILVAALASLASVFFARPAAAAPKPTVAILGLEVVDNGQGIDQASTEAAKGLTDALRQRAKAGTGPFTLAPGSDKELIDQKLLSGCDSEKNDCMAAIGLNLSADQLMFGKLEKHANGYQISMKLLSVGQKNLVRSVVDVIPYNEAQGADLQRWGKSLYAKLVGDSNQGTLLIKANVERGTVIIDDEPKGNLVGGTTKITGLAEGRYRLAIEAEGHQRYEAVVTVTGGQTTNHGATLEVSGLKGGSAQPHGPDGVVVDNGHLKEGTLSQASSGGPWRGVFWGSVVVAAASAGTWYFAYTKVDDAEKGLCSGRHAGEAGCVAATDPVKVKSLTDQGNSNSTLTYVGGALLGVAAIVGGYSLYRGYLSNGAEHAGPMASRRVRRQPFAITPIVTPDGAGASFRLDW